MLPKYNDYMLTALCTGCSVTAILEHSPDGINWCDCALSDGNSCTVLCQPLTSECTVKIIDVPLLQYVSKSTTSCKYNFKLHNNANAHNELLGDKMIGSEIKDLKDGSEFTLPSNARSLMLEIEDHADTTYRIRLQTSHNGVLWHDTMAPLVGDAALPNKLISFDDNSENFLQKVRILVEEETQSNTWTASTPTDAGIDEIKLYFGRSK